MLSNEKPVFILTAIWQSFVLVTCTEQAPAAKSSRMLQIPQFSTSCASELLPLILPLQLYPSTSQQTSMSPHAHVSWVEQALTLQCITSEAQIRSFELTIHKLGKHYAKAQITVKPWFIVFVWGPEKKNDGCRKTMRGSI